MPQEWSVAAVALIFKKGDPSLCGNYCPISFLNLGYRIFASLILGRLKEGGVDDILWPTQYGFKEGLGTTDALFLIRRRLDSVWNAKDEKARLLALDWAKAFDSIAPESLLSALARFGLLAHFVEVIHEIYAKREFFVLIDCLELEF